MIKKINKFASSIFVFLLIAGTCKGTIFAEGEKRYFFLDLDDCFVTRRHAKTEAKLSGNQRIEADDGEHLVLPFAPEFIAFLLSVKNAELFVWSAKERKRNLQIVKQFVLPNGKKLIDYIPKDHVFSWDEISDDLDEMGSMFYSIDPFFAGGSDLKRLGKFLSKEKLQNALLIENLSTNTVKGEEFNLFYIPRDKNLRLGDTQEFLSDLARIEDLNIAATMFKKRFFRENRLAFAASYMQRTLEMSDSKKISLREANAALQFSGESGHLRWRPEDQIGNLRPYRAGLELLRPFAKSPNDFSLVMENASHQKMRNDCSQEFQ